MTGAPRTGQTPRRIGPYEIAGRVASGGMADVYVARKAGERGTPVALKRPRDDIDDVDFYRMFLDEARLAFQINSVHCVSILDVGTTDTGVPYYVMPLIIGAPLSKLVARTSIEPPMAVEIACQAALGLHDAHTARDARGNPLEIVHRDVSPHNILLDLNGRVRVADFGVARAAQRSVRTHTGQIKGKVGYLSPEQAQAGKLDARSDVFCLGIVLWEMLARRRLFQGGNLLEQHRRLMVAPIDHPSDLVPEVPRALGDVVMAALQRSPDQRIRDAVTLGERLRAAMPERVEAQELGRFVSRAAADEVARLAEIVNRVAGHDDTLLSLALPDAEASNLTMELTSETEVTPSTSPEPPTKALGIKGILSKLVRR